ncbi:amino acid ABC transporter permease [Gryllotalpicola ginsengisoli]|uniref:amino acid ABC transporter permease n=1 Tax=Gryllotalpicola ginsengisoli TaxID=444608 RepID=UPI0009D6C9DB|nr:amino acid ABC transporter permease [Gryllotalpicola ginsengisoli]
METIQNLISTFLNPQYLVVALPDILKYGLWNTLFIAIIATAIGIVIGLVLAALGVSNSRVLRWLAGIYTDIFRGLPAALTILAIGGGFAPIVNPITHGNPYPLGIMALALIGGAYIGEIFRAGILAIDKGQLEACRALGMSYNAAMWKVVIPQGIRSVLPSLVNQFIAIVKDSSLVYFLGFATAQRELFRVGEDASVTYANLSPLFTAGVFYLIITVPLTHLVNVIDRRLRHGRAVSDATTLDEDLVAEVPLPARAAVGRE